MTKSHRYSALALFSVFYCPSYTMENPNKELWSTLISYQTKDNYLKTRNKVKELIKAGAKVDLPNNFGVTPIEWAIQSNYYDVYELLLENNARIINYKKFRGDDRFYYITLKHLIHRKIEEHKKGIRTVLMYLKRRNIPGNFITIFKHCLIHQIKVDCTQKVLPYRRSILLNDQDLLHPDHIDATLTRFIDLFMS